MLSSCVKFLSTPSARRATGNTSCVVCFFDISIHALREEGDGASPFHHWSYCHFYPRPPRGGRHLKIGSAAEGYKFLSTPSARRATERQDLAGGCSQISIHALREEGDSDDDVWDYTHSEFLSTPSARRATCAIWLDGRLERYFYPRPPRGGRQQKRRKTSPLLFHYKTICTDLEELFQKHPKNSCDLHRTA